MQLMDSFGEMWARNLKNINLIPGRKSSKGGEGIYILYDGSLPVYVGKGYIRGRVRKARLSKSRGPFWDHFSWYILSNRKLIHDTEVLILRMLPSYLRSLTKQAGHFLRVSSIKEFEENQIAEFITRKAAKKRKKK
jgi:hypothetical protein